MLNLYDVIYNLVNPIAEAYSEHYPTTKEKIYPYAEIKFSNGILNNEFSEAFQLTIDIWNNKSGNVEEIETITNNIDNILKKYQLNNEKMLLNLYRDKPYRLYITDEDVNIQRRQLRYIARVYYKN